MKTWLEILRNKNIGKINILKDGFSLYNNEDQYISITYSEYDDTIYLDQNPNPEIENIIKNAEGKSIYYYFEFSDGFGMKAFQFILEEIYNSMSNCGCFLRDDFTFNLYSVKFFYDNVKAQPYF